MTMKTKHVYTEAEGLRMVGQLLLHHPTTVVRARNRYGESVDALDKDATSWCLVGALTVVGELLNHPYLRPAVCSIVNLRPGQCNLGLHWDCSSDLQRHNWATELANYK